VTALQRIPGWQNATAAFEISKYLDSSLAKKVGVQENSSWL